MRCVLQVACGKCSERRRLAAKALSFCPGPPCLVAAVNSAQNKCFSAINPCGVAVCIRTQCGMEQGSLRYGVGLVQTHVGYRVGLLYAVGLMYCVGLMQLAVAAFHRHHSAACGGAEGRPSRCRRGSARAWRRRGLHHGQGQHCAHVSARVAFAPQSKTMRPRFLNRARSFLKIRLQRHKRRERSVR